MRKLASLSIVVALFVGCDSAGKVKVYPVKGVVTYEGKPMVGGGSISFVPLSNQKGMAAGGAIKPSGTYAMGTHGEADGSMAGDFRVVITQSTVTEPERTPDGTAPPKEAVVTVAAADRIPAIYGNDRESPLITKVEAKPNEINFDLKRQ